MKDKSKIIKNFRSKISELKDHNKFYFSDDNPKITDAKYDELKKDIFELEKKYSFLKKLNLTKNLVGTTPAKKFKKIKHLKPMLSLSNAFNNEDMKDFLKKLIIF